jgi:hypothetical protein
MERVFSVEEIPDPYWAQPSPRGPAGAHPGGEGAMNRCPSEWYFQKFLEEAVLDSPAAGDNNNPSPMAGTSGAAIGGEPAEVKQQPAVPAPAAAVVDPVEYNAMLKQKLEKDLAAVAMWRVRPLPLRNRLLSVPLSVDCIATLPLACLLGMLEHFRSAMRD